ncbi:hypothetical protein [Plasmodium yoelii yoelii]|uniref:Uncharacterized protein n=1 Tax=Plasmodium yoelii yoelii TaxID=73239 RepID=Q7R7R6_PLAYO|nr:hypothetical protein [Plasmodium yoelii yoelii]
MLCVRVEVMFSEPIFGVHIDFIW